MIVKTKHTDWYIPHYETTETVESMLKAYDSYEKGNYRVMMPEDWAMLYDVCIIWDSDNSIGITTPQHPHGRDLTAWLEHVWSYSEYYIGTDRSGFKYFVFKK